MKKIISKFIAGIPYPRNKVRGDTGAPLRWTEAVVRQTRALPLVKAAVFMKAEFYFDSSKYPKDHPHGPDLDNYLKRFQDALNQTIFSKVPGKDGCIQKLYAEKIRVKNKEKSGVKLVIFSNP